MKAQLLHLSGPRRGQTVTYSEPHIVIGSAPDATVWFPSERGVEPKHAEIIFVEEGCSFYLKALEGRVFVNRRETKEIILEDDDLIEIGMSGPKVRFRTQIEPGKPCKPVYLMLSDAGQVGRESGLFASAHTLRRDLIFHSTLTLKIGMLLAFLAVGFFASFLGGALAGKRTAKMQEESSRAQAQLYDRQLEGVRDQLEEFRHKQTGQATREELESLRKDLAARAKVVDDMVARNEAIRRVLNVYSQGVCLIHGIYGFQTNADGVLTEVTTTDGEPVRVEYLGSGFVAGENGLVVTNRHVAEPWWNSENVAPLIAQGLAPFFVQLSAVFPGDQPRDVDPTTIRISDEADVAVLRVDGVDAPVLPLFEGDLQSIRGRRLVLLGYPTGLNALLARAEPDEAMAAVSAATDTTSLIRELASRKMISPIITQGALNEVHEKRLVYDADTTSGGSGGPVFGPDGTVIGVNFAVTPDFGGSNFGVPIDFARHLLNANPPTTTDDSAAADPKPASPTGG